MQLRFSICVSFALLCATSQAAQPDWHRDLGRLFLSPQKREMLDELRKHNAQIGPAQQADTVRLDGIVRRSSGLQTIWINGRAYTRQAPVTRVDDNSARIISGSKSGVELKVGESARLTNDRAPDNAP